MDTRPAPDLDRLRQLLLQLRMWLAEMVLWFAEWLGVKLPRDMHAELLAEFHEARRTVLMIALVHAAALERGRPRPRPPCESMRARSPALWRVFAISRIGAPTRRGANGDARAVLQTIAPRRRAWAREARGSGALCQIDRLGRHELE
jgi:hypothetical protein